MVLIVKRARLFVDNWKNVVDLKMKRFNTFLKKWC